MPCFCLFLPHRQQSGNRDQADQKARFERVVGEAEAAGLRRSKVFEHPQRQRLIEGLAREFQVSEQTMEIRLEKDALLPSLDADL